MPGFQGFRVQGLSRRQADADSPIEVLLCQSNGQLNGRVVAAVSPMFSHIALVPYVVGMYVVPHAWQTLLQLPLWKLKHAVLVSAPPGVCPACYAGCPIL
jgi:hypothetical protein